MGFKRIALLFILSCAVFCAEALSVAFQVVQHGDPEIRSSSFTIEDSMFDFFFGKGIIVSNSPPVVSDAEEKDASFFKKSMQEAWEGGVDYFVEMTVFFTPQNSTNPDSDQLANIGSVSWRLVHVGSGSALGSGKKNPHAGKNYAGLSDFISDIADDIYRIIRR
ncbi:hypothetical protein [Treponema sp.]|uniref:hypothetical protein n=1 Tax=Treponema sp. TaxID=166 RepID=UPI003EFDC3DC